MKICIVGAGAIGGFIGTKLSLMVTHEVNAFARGVTLDALRKHGWRMTTPDGKLLQAPLMAASDKASDLGVQDLVIIAVKAQSLADVASQIAPLMGAHTLVMPAMNGVPWWFCDDVPAFNGSAQLESLDRTGVIAKSIPKHRVIGCVVHASTSTQAAGWVKHHGGQKLIVGEPQGEITGAPSKRVADVVQLLQDAGFDVEHSKNIRYDIWYKLWGNMTMNPVSAMTGATIDKVLGDPLVRDFCSRVMLEAQTIGTAIGCKIEQTPENRHAVTEKLGAFKTSMLQDVEAGRMIELDAIVGAVYEIGERLKLPTTNISALLGLARLYGQMHKVYPT